MILVFAVMFFGKSTAQMAMSGAIFSENPARFNGRIVTVKNVQVVFESQNSMPGAVAPANSNQNTTNSANGVLQRCNFPRGFKAMDILFLENPDFKGCFFMPESMYQQLKKEVGGSRKVDIQLTFRGDNRTGYNVTSYRLGK